MQRMENGMGVRERALELRSGSGDQNVATRERQASLLGGAFLLLYGLSRRSVAGVSLAALGGGLLYRGATGYCPAYGALGVDRAKGDTQASLRASKSVRVEQSVTIERSPADLFSFWRNFENLPRFMENVEKVEIIDQDRSRWHVKGPLGTTVQWEATIHNEIPNELIAWRSLEDSDVANAGSVHFDQVPGGRGTTVRVVLEYYPFAGMVGDAISKMLGTNPETQIVEDLRRFKRLIEAGEIPTIEGQPSGQKPRLTA
jgi:uncharacterized membrane protein